MINKDDNNTQFITKDSGKRSNFPTGMKRDVNEGKPRYDLITPKKQPINMIDRWAALMARGCKKYGDRNWELASTQEELERFLESAERHFNQWKKEILCDICDGEDHAAAILFNVSGAEYTRWKIEQNLG